MALKADGTTVGWGSNTYGQCNVPSPNSGFVAIAAGSSYSLGLKANGSIVAWLALFLWFGVIPAALAWYRRKRTLPGCCLICGYNLTGNLSRICPECGVPIPEEARKRLETKEADAKARP